MHVRVPLVFLSIAVLLVAIPRLSLATVAAKGILPEEHSKHVLEMNRDFIHQHRNRLANDFSCIADTAAEAPRCRICRKPPFSDRLRGRSRPARSF